MDIRNVNNNYYIVTDNTKIDNLFKHKVENDYEADYIIQDRDDLIDDLIRRIAESKSESDKYLMKEDLKMLIALNNDDDQYIFSSTQTNEYVCKSIDQKFFDELCNNFISNNKIK
jgi:hypothetical protein